MFTFPRHHEVPYGILIIPISIVLLPYHPGFVSVPSRIALLTGAFIYSSFLLYYKTIALAHISIVRLIYFLVL